jgi:hypothetical protein
MHHSFRAAALASQRACVATCGPDDAGSGYPAVPPLGCRADYNAGSGYPGSGYDSDYNPGSGYDSDAGSGYDSDYDAGSGYDSDYDVGSGYPGSGYDSDYNPGSGYDSDVGSGYDSDAGSGYPAVPPLPVCWTGRLGAPAGPAGRPTWTRQSIGEADSGYVAAVPTCRGGRRGPTVWPVKYHLASRDIRVNWSDVPDAGGCT